jgi:hypothetical protein
LYATRPCTACAAELAREQQAVVVSVVSRVAEQVAERMGA